MIKKVAMRLFERMGMAHKKVDVRKPFTNTHWCG